MVTLATDGCNAVVWTMKLRIKHPSWNAVAITGTVMVTFM